MSAMLRQNGQRIGLVGLLLASFVCPGKSVPSGYLPVLVLQTGKAVANRNRVPAHALLIDFFPDSGTFGPVDYDGRAAVWVRGNTSFFFPKKSYRLELQTEDGEDQKASLLGMPAESDWVLYASVTDPTFARTVLAHELWRQMGHYAIRWRLVEVFLVCPPAKTNRRAGERSMRPEGEEMLEKQLLGVRGLATRQVRRLLYSSERSNTRATRWKSEIRIPRPELESQKGAK